MFFYIVFLLFFLFLILELGNQVNTTFVLNIMQRIGFGFFFIYEFLNVYLINSFPFWLSNIWDSAIHMLLFCFLFSFLLN